MKSWKLPGISSSLVIIITVTTIVLVTELLFMELLHRVIVPVFGVTESLWNVIDALTVGAAVALAFYFLVFRKLHESEERLRQISIAAQDAIVVIDDQCIITDWNPAAQKMFQYSKEEAVGQQMHQLLAPPGFHADAARGFSLFQKSGGGPLIGKITEITALRKDGSEFPIELSISAVTINNHRYAIGIMRNIAERKHQNERAAALLSLSTATDSLDEKELMQQGLDVIQHLTDSRIGFFHFVNENQNEIELVTWSNDTLAHYCQAVFDKHYPVSAAGIWADCIQLKRAIIINDYATAPNKKGLPEGHAHLQRFISVPIFEGALVRIVVGVGNAPRNYDEHDVETIKLFSYDLYRILQHKRAIQSLMENELQYRALADSGQALIWTASTDKLCHYFNKVWLDFTGRSMEQETGSGWIEGVHPDDLQHYLDVYASAFERREKFTLIYRLRRYDGAYRWLQNDGCPRYNSNGEFIGYIGYCLDVTEYKKVEVELQEMLKIANKSRLSMLSMVEDQMQAETLVRKLNNELEEKVLARTADLEKARHEAEEANRAKSEFLAAMSHEIRTPMNGVIGMLDVLQQSSLTAPQMEMTNIIHDSAFSLLTIINDILDFSRIEAGKLQIESLPIFIEDTVEKACESLSQMASKKNVGLTLFIDPNIPAEVLGDAVRLRQILVNLINNAIKFSSGLPRKGKVSMRALLVASTPEQAILEFQVADNGIGMDEAARKQLFTAFSQADSSTTRTYGGTGLGLAISRQLVTMMNGEITVQSEAGKGSLFSLRIPFKLLEKPAEIHEQPSPVAGLSCLVTVGTETLLDDLAVYLVHAGALVERVTDLTAVKAWIEHRTPGLYVIVIDMAGIEPPLVTSLLDSLRAASREVDNVDVRFVAIGRGGRQHCRIVGADMIELDAEVMHRHALLDAVAIAAGRAKQAETEIKHSDAAVKQILSREKALLEGRLILVAEDNDINQKVLQKQLALLGQIADISSNGHEALKRWQSGHYALLFADLHMPVMDGYELTAAIRAAEKNAAHEHGKAHIPIIAFTANALKGETERCLAIGMDDYLSKPVQLSSLKAMLNKWLPTVVPVDEMAPDRIAHLNALPASTPAPVDVNALKELIGDDEAIVAEFLHDFNISATSIAAELRTACTLEQAMAAGNLAHKLKSSARSVGAIALGERCAEMERAGKAGDMKALQTSLHDFEQELTCVQGFIATY